MMNLNIEPQPTLRSTCLLFNRIILLSVRCISSRQRWIRVPTNRYIHTRHPPSLSSINSLPSQPSPLDTNRAVIRISFLHDAAFSFQLAQVAINDDITVMQGLIIMRRDEYPKKWQTFAGRFREKQNHDDLSNYMPTTHNYTVHMHHAPSHYNKLTMIVIDIFLSGLILFISVSHFDQFLFMYL